MKVIAGEHDRVTSSWPRNVAVLGFFGATLVLGGAGERFLTIELLLALTGAVVATRHWLSGALRSGPSARLVTLLGLLWLVLGLVTLVPLPPFVWQSVAAGSPAQAVFAALGFGSSWHATSLDPDRTVMFLLSCVVPLAGFLLAYSQTLHDSVRTWRLVVLLAFVSALLACFQFGSGGEPFLYLFSTKHQGVGTGFFINRNHLALLLLIALPMLTSLYATSRMKRKSTGAGMPVFMLAFGILVLGVLASLSRTAAVLLLPVGTFCVLSLRDKSQRKAFWPKLAISITLLLALASQMPVSRSLLDRFSVLADDFRYLYWDNTLFLIRQHFPWGTGPGSFARLYASAEPLTQVRPEVVGHAHNDWLEVLLELGISGALLVAAAVAIIVMSVRRALARAPRNARPLVIAAAIGLGLIASFSAVDFPLRMPALALLGGSLLGFICRQADADDAIALPASPHGRSWIVIVLLSGAGLLLSASVVARQLARAGLGSAAVVVAPWSGSARAARAQEKWDRGDVPGAIEDARAALSQVPLDPASARTLAEAFSVQKRPDEALRWLSLTAGMGWRDPMAQEWIGSLALASQQPSVAAERYDALLRQGADDRRYYDALVQIAQRPQGAPVLADRLEEKPGWHRGFFNALADAPPPPQAISGLLRELARRSVVVTGQDTSLLRWKLWETQNFSEVNAIWRDSRGTGLMNSAMPDVELPQTAAPYEWSAPSIAGAIVAVEDNGLGQRRLRIFSDGNAAGAFLAQSLALEPGLYRLDLGTQADSSLPLRVALLCYSELAGRWDETERVLARIPANAGGRVTRILVPISEDCPGQVLRFALDTGAGASGTTVINKVAIDTAASHRALNRR